MAKKNILSDEQEQLIYQWYFSGMPMPAIEAKILQDFNIKIAKNSIYYHIKHFRKQHEEALSHIIEKNVESKYNQYEYWLQYLENQVNDPNATPDTKVKFIKLIEEMLWKQLNLADNGGNGAKPGAQFDEAGKQSFLDELQKLANKTVQDK